MFKVENWMREQIRKDVKSIMHGASPGVRGLGMPAYLGGEFRKKLGANPHSVEELLNPVDPKPYTRHWKREESDD